LTLLLDEKNEKGVRTLGSQLESGLGAYNHAYDETMKRIEQQSSHSQDLARRVLGWVTFSARPLTAVELQYAIAVEIGEPTFDETNITDIEEMISVCSGLVVIEETSNIAKLVHFTAQEYLRRMWKSWFPDVHGFLTDTCLTYLSFDNFDDSCLTRGDPQVQREEYPFYQYSAHELRTHLRHSLGNDSLLQAFIGNDAKVSRCMREMFGLSGSQCSFTGLHLASLFGLEHIVEGIPATDSNFNVWDYLGRTPLIWAAASGNETVVRLLLDRGADPNSGTKEGFTPLFYAAAYGHVAVVRILIEGGASVDFENKSKETPIFFAAKGDCGVRLGPRSLFNIGDHTSVVRLLLDAGASLEHWNNRRETPLYTAAEYGHEMAVGLLLERNANINPHPGEAPLTAAARKGHVKITKLLLENGADTPTLRRDMNLSRYSYALSCLSASGIDQDESSFAAMLQESGDPRFQDEFKRLPLHWAASRGDESLVQSILKAGCDPNPKDIFGRTPSFAAVCMDRVGVVKLLLDHPDIDAQIEDKLGFTPLQESYRRQMQPPRDQPDIVAQMRARAKLGFTPLQASYRRQMEPYRLEKKDSLGGWVEITNLLKVKTGLQEECLPKVSASLFARYPLPQQAFYPRCDVCLDIKNLGFTRKCKSCDVITKKDGTSGGTVLYCQNCIQEGTRCPLCRQSF